ncbi:MAG: hypothetical protein K2H09_00045 [Treponemataceae bacterium]|nr:hypothetical protein [Treponemataceae bacterium]
MRKAALVSVIIGILFYSCGKPIDGHDVTDFKILNNAEKAVTFSLNGEVLTVEKNAEMYVSVPMDSSVEIEEAVENHLACTVRRAVFHNERFYNYIEIDDVPSYSCIASNMSSFEIEIVFGEAQGDRLTILPMEEDADFTSYVRKEEVRATFAGSGTNADDYVRVEYKPVEITES